MGNFNTRFTFVIILAIFFGCSFSSCEKIEDLASFDITYSNPDLGFTVDSVAFLQKSEVLLFQKILSINIDSIISKHELDGIENAQFETVMLNIESPDGVNFNWFTSGRVTVSSMDLSETEIASTTSVPNDSRSIEFVLTNKEVLSTIKADRFTLKLYGKVAPPIPARTLQMVLESKIKMRVLPL
jgi:hypothetical protein